MTRLLFLLLLCLYGVGQVLAETQTRYITDQTQIMMRAGESTKHKIVRTLNSGEAVEEIQGNKSTGYSKVQTQDGATGYVLTRQLQEEPVARERLDTMQTRLAELQKAPDQLNAKLTELRAAYDKLALAYKAVQGKAARLEQELAAIKHASANIVQVTEERSELRKDVADLTRQVADLQQESRDLKNQTNQRWFLIGAGVMAGGILIGLILPNLRLRRRKDSWGSL